VTLMPEEFWRLFGLADGPGPAWCVAAPVAAFVLPALMVLGAVIADGVREWYA
jgi:hypothetical protein